MGAHSPARVGAPGRPWLASGRWPLWLSRTCTDLAIRWRRRRVAGNYSIGFLLALMVGRALYTSFTIGMGGSGGVFAPTLFIGAMAGAAFGDALSPVTNSPVGVFAVVGMGAAFAGAARAPMTAVLIIVEMTGQFSLILPMMLAVVIATGTSRFLTRATIYTEKLRRRGDAS